MAVQGTNGGPPGGQEPLNLAVESCSVFVNGLSLEVCASFMESLCTITPILLLKRSALT